jgi:hypothetical protein
MKQILLYLPVILIIFIHPGIIHPEEKYKTVEISGLKILTPLSIINKFNLNSLPAGKKHFVPASKQINAFYHKNGYVLARVFLIEENDSTLRIFIDEGRIWNIIFHHLDAVDTLKLKYEFSLEKKIYNRFDVEKELKRIREKYGFKKIYATLKLSRQYDKSAWQMDREFDIPFLGKSRLPFFDEYKNLYDLEIFPIKKSLDKSGGSVYGFDTNYTKGFMPYFKYYLPSIVTSDDLLECGVSAGIFYGFDLKFDTLPRWTFMEIGSAYHFTPTLKEYFTPMLKGLVYRSWSSRKDLGIDEYEYLKLRGVILPGVTLLRKFKMNFGYGAERVYIYDGKVNPDSKYSARITSKTDDWNFIEYSIDLDFLPWSLKRTEKRKLNFLYNYYFNGKSFHYASLQGSADHEFKNFNIFAFNIDFMKSWESPPFYYEIPVDNANFRGFMGKSFYTRRITRLSSEYKISIYRDIIFAGIYF